MEQVLSTILLQYYLSDSLIDLTKDEQTKILQIVRSKTRFSFCYTCTYSEEGTLRQFFARKKNPAAHNLVRQKLLNTP